MFVPTLELLVEWQTEHLIMDELSWNCVFSSCSNTSRILAHPSSPHELDPNDVLNPEALRHWLKFSDFYQWPGIIYFQSWEDLVEKVMNTNLPEVSAIMGEHKRDETQKTLKTWQNVIRPLLNKRPRQTKSASFFHFSRKRWEALVKANYPTLVAESFSSRC